MLPRGQRSYGATVATELHGRLPSGLAECFHAEATFLSGQWVLRQLSAVSCQMSGGQGEAPAPDALTTVPGPLRAPLTPGLGGDQESCGEVQGLRWAGICWAERPLGAGGQGHTLAWLADEMIEPCKAGACPRSVLCTAWPSAPGLSLRLILPCSLLLSGGAVRPHQSDPAAWNRPRGAGADGGRGHVHPGVCWLCGGPAGEHLPAQIREWPHGQVGDAWGALLGRLFPYLGALVAALTSLLGPFVRCRPGW